MSCLSRFFAGLVLLAPACTAFAQDSDAPRPCHFRHKVRFADGQTGCLTALEVGKAVPLGQSRPVHTLVSPQGRLVLAGAHGPSCPVILAASPWARSAEARKQEALAQCDRAMQSSGEASRGCKCALLLVDGTSPLTRTEFETGEPPSPVAAPDPRQPAAPRSPGIVAGSGSGFLVGSKAVITNHHVVEGCSRVSVQQAGSQHPATVVSATPGSDLALVAVDSDLGAAPALRTGARLGEDVLVAGHPLSQLLSSDLIVTSGQVNSLAGLRNDPLRMQISAPIQPGNSGGPLIDRYGAVVGVVVAKLNVQKVFRETGDLAQNINFAIKPEVLRLFLETNRVPYLQANSRERLDNVELAELARKFTVRVICYK